MKTSHIRAYAALTFMATLLTGCAGGLPSPYPAGKDVSISVSDMPVPLAGMAIGTWHIKDSQLYIAGDGSYTIATGSAVVTIGPKRPRVEYPRDLPLRFTEIASTAIADTVPRSTLRLNLPNADTPIVVRPYIEFNVITKERTRPYAYFDVAYITNRYNHRRQYIYPIPEVHSLTGPGSWEENGGARLKELAPKAFAALATALVNDYNKAFDDAVIGPLVTRKLLYRADAAVWPRPFAVLGKSDGLVYLSYINVADQKMSMTKIVAHEDEIELLP